MHDPVDRVLAERESLGNGIHRGVFVSACFHVGLAGAALAFSVQWARSVLSVSPLGVVVMESPVGGGGEQPLVAARSNAPASTAARAPAQARVTRPSRPAPGIGPPQAARQPTPSSPLGRPPGPDAGGEGGTGIIANADLDWYLSFVQSRIWSIWVSQPHPQPGGPATIEFTIAADGQVQGIRPVVSSGDSVFDMAAQRSIHLAGPFSPSGTARTIHAVFRPE